MSNFNSFRENYPPRFDGPIDVRQKVYYFEVHGEIPVLGYSEEDAENEFKENRRDYIDDAIINGDLEII